MNLFASMLQYLRKREGLTQEALADRLTSIGEDVITRSAVSMWESGKRIPKFQVLETIADYFNVDMNTLTGKASENATPALSPLPAMHNIPLLGRIHCGDKIDSEENVEGYVVLPDRVRADFALRCIGDSMINARIFDGDIVYIRSQPVVDNGQIAAVRVDGEATLKRVRLFSDHIVLEPENPQYRPLVYWEHEMDQVRILGLAVAFTSTVR